MEALIARHTITWIKRAACFTRIGTVKDWLDSALYLSHLKLVAVISEKLNFDRKAPVLVCSWVVSIEYEFNIALVASLIFIAFEKIFKPDQVEALVFAAFVEFSSPKKSIAFSIR